MAASRVIRGGGRPNRSSTPTTTPRTPSTEKSHMAHTAPVRPGRIARAPMPCLRHRTLESGSRCAWVHQTSSRSKKSALPARWSLGIERRRISPGTGAH
ncbi:hypothetical protein NDU88_005932 [Pleurodeles waltl]|uniref:Uncharacterized protein n=1 Tax=Pleurodeles waltl TaxID=8319 RepID=A0AAV7PLW9_PLEWA|nr:hypothetical protein NDU88_005932 [Pleurodeles waltl]